MKKFFLFFFLIVPIYAKPILTVKCDEPKGTSFDFINGEIQSTEDGISGSRPVFILDDEKPNSLLVLWEHSDQAPIESSAKEATILVATGDKITAALNEGGVILLFSLFPNEGVVYFTQHRYRMNIPNCGSFYCKAKFIQG